jgi:hypothetical protein
MSGEHTDQGCEVGDPALLSKGIVVNVNRIIIVTRKIT